MRRRVIHSVVGLSLVAAVLAVPPTTAGAQGWAGFSTLDVPSAHNPGGSNESPGWGAATTEDLGGAGVDLWVNNHGIRSEALEDFSATGSPIFADSILAPMTPIDSHGNAFTDIDGDGDEDLIEVSGRNHDNRVYRNDSGTLTLIATTTGLEDFAGRGRQPLMVDIDNDGDMDAFVANLDRTLIETVPGTPDDPEPSELYLNDGDSTWTKVADPTTVIPDGNIRLMQHTSTGPGTPMVVLTSSTSQFASDTIATGSGTLAAAATPVNTSEFAAHNMTHVRDVALGDLDGDLSPEFIVARQDDFLATDDAPADGTPDLLGLLPIGMGQVSTSGIASRVIADITGGSALADNCRSIAVADYDNDADLDIFAGCTMLEKTQDQNVLLLNDGTGSFTVNTSMVPVSPDNETATVVVATDFNKDGWMDTYVGTGHDSAPGVGDGPDTIFLNQGGGGNHWLQIDLVGSNPDAAGAQVFVGTDKWQVRETGHRYHQGQDTKILHFGLGSEDTIAPVEIMWPDGTFQSCTVDGGVDQRVTITKGGAGCVAQTMSGMLAALAAAPDREPPVLGPMCRARVATVNIALGESPTEGDDVILGTDGNDTINGLGGDDFICGGAGDDVINGGDGNDRLFGDEGVDTIDGGKGRDVIQGGLGNDHLTGGLNNDRISGNAGKDMIFGSNGRDRLNGNVGNDTITGGGGNDRMDGSSGANDVGFGKVGTDFCAGFETQSSCELAL